MKLFIIIYVAGAVGGWAGPLPYDMDECVRRAAGMQMEADASTDPEANAMSFACEYRDDDERPYLGQPEPMA